VIAESTRLQAEHKSREIVPGLHKRGAMFAFNRVVRVGFAGIARSTLPSSLPTFIRTAIQNRNRPIVSSIIRRSFSGDKPPLPTVPITFVEPDGEKTTVDADVGSNFLEVAHAHNIELEGACGGELACSTCHLVFDEDTFDSLAEMEEEEEDMLDLAWGLTDTSRLGCQVCIKEEMANIEVIIPDED